MRRSARNLTSTFDFFGSHSLPFQFEPTEGLMYGILFAELFLVAFLIILSNVHLIRHAIFPSWGKIAWRAENKISFEDVKFRAGELNFEASKFDRD